MTRIGILSDTHGYLDPKVFQYFAAVDEIWHVGDIGTTTVTEQLQEFKPLRAVYGNIDGTELRQQFRKTELFTVEKKIICMTHIGGRPPNYNPEARELLQKHQPDIFVCGHSHILKVMFDKRFNTLYINPGAAGFHGFHKVKTLLRFNIDGEAISDMEVIELGPRSKM